jgi:queuosine precursor transporter
MNRTTAAALAVYAGTIPAANWAINNVGTVQFPGGPHTIPAGFGYSAPSGVALIGLALVARDVIHQHAGRRAALAAICVGVALSVIVSPAIAFASAAAFGLGELADLAIYSPLRERNLPAAVLTSGAVGAVVDSLVFLWLAFGSVTYWQGNTLGKVWMSAAAAALLWGQRAVSHRLDTEAA